MDVLDKILNATMPPASTQEYSRLLLNSGEMVLGVGIIIWMFINNNNIDFIFTIFKGPL